MAIRKHANNYSSTLNGAITDVATTLVVTSASGLPSIGAGEEYNLTLDDGAGTIEIVTVTDDSSSPTLTVTRGAEGTSNVAWDNGSTIELRPTADGFDRKADGAASSTDNAIVRFDGTGGKVLQNSTATVDDSGNLDVQGNITVSGTVDGRDVATDGTKLDGVESGADVTDEANVTSALDGATLTDVGTPASGDLILLQDASDSNNLKVAQFSTFGGGSGDWTLISSATASSSATVDFTGLSSSYISYVVILTNIVPATDGANLQVRFGTGGGPTWSSASTYHFAMVFDNEDASSGFFDETGFTYINIGNSMGSATGENANAKIMLYNPSSSLYKTMNFETAHINSAADTIFYNGVGGWKDTTAVTGIRFLFSTGNIASGEFRLFGLSAS